MDIRRQQMIITIKEKIVPVLREIGFKGSFPHFRRFKENKIDLITFQFDRNGGGFVIEIATAENEPYKMSYGEIIEEKKLTANHLDNRTRIHPKGLLKNSCVEDWFRYDKTLYFGCIYSKVADQILKNIKLIESIFNN